MKNLTVFVSQPFNGVEKEVIFDRMIRIKENLKKITGCRVAILDNYNHINVPDEAGRIWHLGESIKLLDKADLVIFSNDYDKAKGCKVERKLCQLYGIPYFHETLLEPDEYYNDYEKKLKIFDKVDTYRSHKKQWL